MTPQLADRVRVNSPRFASHGTTGIVVSHICDDVVGVKPDGKDLTCAYGVEELVVLSDDGHYSETCDLEQCDTCYQDELERNEG